MIDELTEKHLQLDRVMRGRIYETSELNKEIIKFRRDAKNFIIIAMLLIGIIIGSGTVGYFHWAWKLNRAHIEEVNQ